MQNFKGGCFLKVGFCIILKEGATTRLVFILDVVELACVKVAVRVVTIFLLFFFFYGMNSWLRVNHYKPISKVFLS